MINIINETRPTSANLPASRLSSLGFAGSASLQPARIGARKREPVRDHGFLNLTQHYDWSKMTGLLL